MKSQVHYIRFLVVEIFIRVVDIIRHLIYARVDSYKSLNTAVTVETQQPTGHLCHSLLQAVTEGRTIEMLHFHRLNHIFLVNFTLLLLPAIYTSRGPRVA